MTNFSFKKRLGSFKYAFRGIVHMFMREQNAWIHALAVIVVTVAGISVQLSKTEWLFVILSIGLVLMAEAFNTAIEQLANAVSETYNEKLKNAKDVAAGAVLLAATTAALIGLLVFIPHIIEIFA